MGKKVALFVIFITVVLAGAVIISAAPQPSFEVTAKVVKISGDKMDIEILEIGKMIKPGLYGSFMRDKYKQGDKLSVTVADKALKAKAGNVIKGTLEKITDKKGSRDEMSGITVEAANQGMYDMRKKFRSDTAVLKVNLYGSE